MRQLKNNNSKNKSAYIKISHKYHKENNSTYVGSILSNYSYTAGSGLFLYFLNFSGQPSFYTEL